MNEHKTYRMVDEKYCTDCVCVIPSEVYIKSEADKVIAELEESHKKEVEQLMIETKRLENLCASYKDLILLHVNGDSYGQPVKKQRDDCMCLAKRQILGTIPRRCPHGCLYCFWQD